MKALLYKDFVASKSTYLGSILVALPLATYGLIRGVFLFLPLLCLYLPIILNAASFGSEAQCNFFKFAFTTPLSRKRYVRSKYLHPLFFSFLAFILTFIYLAVKGEAMRLALLVSAVALVLPLLFASLQLPFIFKFGADKSQLIMLATFMVLFVGTSYLGSNFEALYSVTAVLRHLNPYLLVAGLIVLMLSILGLSLAVSQKIIAGKEY